MTDAPSPTQLDSWQAAEQNASAWMRHWGFADAHVTAGGADGGIDVRSAEALAQVKFEARQIGAPAVQRLVGARGRDEHKALLFFSGVGYAQPAVVYADSMDVALFKYDLLGKMTAVNDAARQVIRRQPTVAPMLTITAEETRPTGRRWLGRNWQLLAGPLFVYVAIDMLLHPEAGTSRSENIGPSIVGLVLGLVMLLFWLANGDERTEWKALRDGTARSKPASAKPPPVIPDPRAFPDVMDHLARDAMIEAVKAYRQATGMGLAEATRAVLDVRESE